jgi:hypothetical protein
MHSAPHERLNKMQRVSHSPPGSLRSHTSWRKEPNLRKHARGRALVTAYVFMHGHVWVCLSMSWYMCEWISSQSVSECMCVCVITPEPVVAGGWWLEILHTPERNCQELDGWWKARRVLSGLLQCTTIVIYGRLRWDLPRKHLTLWDCRGVQPPLLPPCKRARDAPPGPERT